MWAPTRRTAPSLAAAGGGEPVAEEHVLVDLQAVGDQGGAGVVAQVAPSQSRLPPMWAPSQADRAVLAAPVAVNPPRRNMSWSTCRPSALRAGPESLRRSAPAQSRLAADVGAEQADRAGVGMADDPCPVQVEHAAGEPVGVQRWLDWVFDLASGQANGSQVGIPGEDAFLQEAIFQLKVDIRGEVFQIEPTGDPGAPKPQPMRIRVGARAVHAGCRGSRSPGRSGIHPTTASRPRQPPHRRRPGRAIPRGRRARPATAPPRSIPRRAPE